MYQNLNDILVKAIEKAGGYIDKGIDLAVQQVPDIINQLILWNLSKASLYAGVSFIFMILWLLLFRKIYNMYDPNSVCISDEEGFGYFLSVVGFLVSFCIFVSKLLIIIQIWVAPKIWLIEYAAGLIKK